MFKNKNGITVAELKKFVMSLPDVDDDGEEYEVWLKSGDGVSSPCIAINVLNKSDIYLSYQDAIDVECKHDGECYIKGEWYNI